MKIFAAFCFLALGANALPVQEPSEGLITEKGNIGRSGILRADGSTDLFSHDLAHDILYFGPAGIITKSGRNIQLTADLGLATARTKRDTVYASRDANIGDSGIVNPDGVNVQFLPGQFGDFVLRGPSGIVTSNGNNIQLLRKKRHLIGDSGMILDDGTQIQFLTGEVGILLEGPSAIILTDGTQIQKKAA